LKLVGRLDADHRRNRGLILLLPELRIGAAEERLQRLAGDDVVEDVIGRSADRFQFRRTFLRSVNRNSEDALILSLVAFHDTCPRRNSPIAGLIGDKTAIPAFVGSGATGVPAGAFTPCFGSARYGRAASSGASHLTRLTGV